MGTYDTRGGAPLHDPAADFEGPCEVCNKDLDDCECPEWFFDYRLPVQLGHYIKRIKYAGNDERAKQSALYELLKEIKRLIPV